MRKVATGGAVALGLALLASAARGQPGTGRPPAERQGVFAAKPKPEDTKPAAVAPSPAAAAREQERQLNAYLRRLGVSDRLKDIALQAGDEALFQEAERLADLALKVYEQNAARLGSGAATLADVTGGRPAGGKADGPGRAASAREGKR